MSNEKYTHTLSQRWMRAAIIIVLGVSILPFFCRGLTYGVKLVSGINDRPEARQPMRDSSEKNRGQRKHIRDKRQAEEQMTF